MIIAEHLLEGLSYSYQSNVVPRCQTCMKVHDVGGWLYCRRTGRITRREATCARHTHWRRCTKSTVGQCTESPGLTPSADAQDECTDGVPIRCMAYLEVNGRKP